MRKSLLLFFVFGLIIACKKEKNAQNQESVGYSELYKNAISIFQPLSSVEYEEIKPELATLGKYLYFDTRLSNKGNISCNSCHDLHTFGVDNLPTSPGDDGITGARNSPSVIYASLHAMQFWDGRAEDVEEQAGGPILNPVEHNIKDKQDLVKRIENVDLYIDWFGKVFPEESTPITFENITKAIGAFERTLRPESRFDKYLEGDENQLNAQEKRGLEAFISNGCITCHNGVTLGGQMFQKFGVYDEYWKWTQSKEIDNGLFDLTQKETDKHLFKVPGLRNITKTAPYFHDGSVASLEEVVRIMGNIQANVKITEEEIRDIVAFLDALTADLTDEVKRSPFE